MRCSTLVSLLAATLTLAAPALAQKFSSPEAPAKTEAPATAPAGQPPAAAPQQDDPNNHRVGNGGSGFTLPLTLYDEETDAARDISAACIKAKKDNRRVLLMWGENRCEFCAFLNQLMTTDPRIKQLIETEYVWIKVNIGKFDKNIELAHQFDVPIDKQGFGAPALAVVEPNGPQSIGVVGGNEMVAKPMTMQRVFDELFVYNFLDKNKPQPKVANSLLLDSQVKAKRDGKRVLVYFNVYGSDACKAFDAAVTSDSALARTLDKAFSVRKLDVERNINGYTLLRTLKGNPLASPPWMTVIDGEGKPVAEAGKGLEFDLDAAAEAAKWIVGASAGKLDATDEAAIAEALKPRPKEEKKEAAVPKEAEAVEEAKK